MHLDTMQEQTCHTCGINRAKTDAVLKMKTVWFMDDVDGSLHLRLKHL